MRSLLQWQLALGLALLGAAAGCRSLPSPPPPVDGGLVSSPVLTPEQDLEARAHALYATGIHYELEENYPAAYEAYRRALELDPGNEQLVLRMASSLIFQRQTEKALMAVEKFLERNPDSEKALLWLATFYGTTGETERVIELFTQMTRTFPANPVGWMQLASRISMEKGNEAAIEVLQQGIEQAKPPTQLRKELVRIYLARLQEAATDADAARERERAIRELRQIDRELPGDTDTLLTLGDLLLGGGSLDDAIAIYEKTARLQPDNRKVQQRLAAALLEMDRPDQAISVLEKLVHDHPGAGSVHFYLGDLYLQSGEYAKAEIHFQQAAENAGDDPNPWMKLAAVQAETNDALAASTLDRALELMPDNPKLLEVLGLVRLSQKRYKQAADLLQQVYDLTTAEDPGAIPSNLFFYNFALVQTHRRQTAEAAGWLGRALKQEPGLLDLYVQRALTGTRSFQTAAGRVLRHLAEHTPAEAASVYSHLATLYLSQEEPERAVDAFEKAIAASKDSLSANNPFPPRFHFWFGVALDQAGRTDEAVEQFETCIRQDPSCSDALNYLAYLWAMRGIRLDEARQHIRTALELEPENPAYLDTLGWVLYQQGQYDRALEYLLQADELRPNDPEIREHIEKTRKALTP